VSLPDKYVAIGVPAVSSRSTLTVPQDQVRTLQQIQEPKELLQQATDRRPAQNHKRRQGRSILNQLHEMHWSAGRRDRVHRVLHVEGTRGLRKESAHQARRGSKSTRLSLSSNPLTYGLPGVLRMCRRPLEPESSQRRHLHW
jgi:hypothetical protein